MRSPAAVMRSRWRRPRKRAVCSQWRTALVVRPAAAAAWSWVPPAERIWRAWSWGEGRLETGWSVLGVGCSVFGGSHGTEGCEGEDEFEFEFDSKDEDEFDSMSPSRAARRR